MLGLLTIDSKHAKSQIKEQAEEEQRLNASDKKGHLGTDGGAEGEDGLGAHLDSGRKMDDSSRKRLLKLGLGENDTQDMDESQRIGLSMRQDSLDAKGADGLISLNSEIPTARSNNLDWRRR